MRQGNRKVYPPSGKNLFDGGQNNKFEKSIIDDNESPECLNVVFDAGSVGTRDGFKKVNTATVGTYVCDGLYTRHGSNNAETMVAFYGGNGYTLDGTSLVTIPSAQSVYTAGQRIGCSQMEQHLFIGNGAITPYKYNGLAFTRHGVPAPSFVSNINSNGAGNLNGDYTYKMTWVNTALVEGNPSVALGTFTVATKKILLSSLPVAPQSYGVAARRIYRTVAGGSSYLRVATINDNTTTTYDDNIADASLGAAAPSDNGEPPLYSTIIYHQNRLFMNDAANPSYVWYTELNEPYTVKALSFTIIGDSSTDEVRGFMVQGNDLVVFCERNVWLWYMPDNDPTNWQTVKCKSAFSSKSPFGAFRYNDKTGFPAVQNDKFVGIGVLSGTQVEPSATFLTVGSMGGELKSDRIEPDMFDVQESYLAKISSMVFKNKAYISVTKGSGQTTNNYVYVMDFSIDNLTKKQKESWCPWTGLNVAQWAIYSGELYYGTSTATGYLYKQNPGVYTDDGSAINSYAWTKEFSGYPGDESFSKDFRYTNLLVDLAGTYYMSVAARTDSDDGDGTNYPLDLDPHASVWGTMVWGVDTWGAGASQKDMRLYLSGARGKRIQYKFSNQNTAGQRFKVHWQNFTYNLKGPR
jgi:hypothetical protein